MVAIVKVKAVISLNNPAVIEAGTDSAYGVIIENGKEIILWGHLGDDPKKLIVDALADGNCIVGDMRGDFVSVNQTAWNPLTHDDLPCIAVKTFAKITEKCDVNFSEMSLDEHIHSFNNPVDLWSGALNEDVDFS